MSKPPQRTLPAPSNGDSASSQPPTQPPQVALPELDVHICGRCGRAIHFGAYETCWYCTAALCSQCWDIWGHCGHAEADEQNDRARMVPQPAPPLKTSCTCSPQPRRARPFVRVDGAGIIFLDDFIGFQTFNQSLRGLARGPVIITLYEYETCSDALDTLDAIQAAIEHWNQAATEPERNVQTVAQDSYADVSGCDDRLYFRNDDEMVTPNNCRFVRIEGADVP